MSTQKYSVAPHPIETLLTWVKSKEIAIPEIQRPFVWDAVQVRTLLDSLYKGYPIGYLISWRNPSVKLKDGTLAAGKRILIDGQQRVTALMAALLGREVLTDDYQMTRIKIAFHPLEERFEVSNPAIQKDPAWIKDVAEVFAPDAYLYEITENYTKNNPEANRRDVEKVVQRLGKIVNNHVGIIELADELEIETVADIFIRVNSAGTRLSQADFAMSKIAVNEDHGGNMLRKAIDHFCHAAASPEFIDKIEKQDTKFAESEFFRSMKWLKDASDDIYDPSYTDMLRVAFTSEFARGKLQDLVALLSGRNFESKQFEEATAEASFSMLKRGVLDFINQTHFERFTMILRSAGFITRDLIGGLNAVNFAYILYLRGRREKVAAAVLESLVRRWYAMSILTGRYAGNPETAFDQDIRRIGVRGLVDYVESVLGTSLPDSFWAGALPIEMDTTSVRSPYFLAYQAAMIKAGERGFLSRDINVRDLLLNRGDVHHIYPKNYLKKIGVPKSRHNQIANFAIAQSEINIAIGDRPPGQYFLDMARQDEDTPGKKIGAINDRNTLLDNLKSHDIPECLLSGEEPAYDDFLNERRRKMALRIKKWYEML